MLCNWVGSLAELPFQRRLPAVISRAVGWTLKWGSTIDWALSLTTITIQAPWQ